jgi:glycopeptide antibiotics resistance protein
LISVSVCLTVSLFIEVFQAWVPSRSSSSLDLMLNGFGGWLGTVTYRRFVMGA